MDSYSTSVRASIANVVTSGVLTFEWCSIEYRNGIYNIFGRVYQDTAVTISDGAVIGTIRQDLDANPHWGFPVNVHNFQNGQDYVLWFEVDGTIKIYGIGTQTLTFDFYINATYVK